MVGCCLSKVVECWEGGGVDESSWDYFYATHCTDEIFCGNYIYGTLGDDKAPTS